MPIERYLFALLPEDGYTVRKTMGLNNVSDSSIEYLRRCPVSDKEYVYWLPDEQMVVVQRVEKNYEFPDMPLGEQGRGGVWNSAALIPINDYLRLTNPVEILSQYLVPKSDKAPERLESVTV